MAYIRSVYYTLPDWFKNTGNLSIDSTDVSADLRVAGTKQGEKVDQWRSKIASGKDATSYYFAERYATVVDRPGSVNLVRVYKWFAPEYVPGQGTVEELKRHGYSIRARNFAAPYHLHSVSPEQLAQVRSRLLDKIREDSYGVNGLLVLGEIHQTIQMLRNPASALRDGLDKFFLPQYKSKGLEVRRRVRMRRSETPGQYRARKANAFKNAIAGTWLEFAFGVQPAISDAKDICREALNLIEKADNRVERIRAKSKKVANAVNDWSNLTQLATTCLWKKTSFTRTTFADVQEVAGLKRDITAPIGSLQHGLERFGFQLQNFVPTIWELVPWSFLIDYFVNIGEVLEAACTDTSKVLWVSQTKRQVSDSIMSGDWEPYNEIVNPRTIVLSCTHKPDLRVFRKTTVERTKVSGSIQFVPLRLSVPGTDSSKWFNMAALLAQFKNFRA